jgi:transglutaminase-like putative cysteine protease
VQPGTSDSAEQKSKSASANSTQDNPDYSQEPYVFERFVTQVAFQKDGTSRADLQVVINVLSEAGVQRFGQLVFAYNSSNQKLEVISVEIRKAGSSSFTSASAVRDVAPFGSGGAPAYSDYREKRVTVPGLRPGDTVAYHIARTITIPLAPDQFWFEHDFVKDAIVLDEQLEISVPRNSAIKLKTEPGADPVISDETERRIYRWKRSRPTREGKAPEKNKWASESQVPDVQLATFENWEDVGRCYAPLVRERAMPDAAVRAKAEELTRGRATETEKIEALYDFVATKVRTVNVPFGLGGYSPHAASETLKNEYGDPKDKHTLLQALLEAAGIRAFPALVSSTRNLDPDFASPGEFNHLITVISRGADGKDWLWLDTSTEVAPFRMLAPSLRGKRALVTSISAPGATSKLGAPLLLTTPADPPSVQVQNIDVTGQVDEHGKLTAHVHYSMTGDNALTLRMAFRHTPESSWKQLAQLLASGDGFSGEVSAVKSGDPTDTHKPFEVDYEISQASFADWSRKILQLRLPLPALGIPEPGESPDGQVKRLKLGSPLEIHVHATIELPASYAPRAPVPVSMSREFASYQSNYSVKENIVEAKRDLVFRQREISEDLIADYSAFTRAARADEAQLVPVELSPQPVTSPGATNRNPSK